MAQVPAAPTHQLPRLTEFCGVDAHEHRVAIDLSPGKTWLGWLVSLIELIEADQAKEAGRANLRESADHLISMIMHWYMERRDAISNLFLTMGDGRLLLLVVAREQEYDEALHDSLINLDLAVYDNPAVKPYKLATRLVPEMDGAYATFLREGCFLDLTARSDAQG